MANLKGVDKRLIDVFNLARDKYLSKNFAGDSLDMKIIEGMRSYERQRKLYEKGASQTLQSNHLTGNAIDVIPVVNGKEEHGDWFYFYPVANAMDKAADELGVILTWGAAWTGTTETWDDSKEAVNEYKAIRRSQGRSVFLDGAHWEIPKRYQGKATNTIDKNTRTKELQKFLNKYSSNLKEDGMYGPKTKAALDKFLDTL